LIQNEAQLMLIPMHMICCESVALCSPHRWHPIRCSCWGGYCGRWRLNTISLYSALSSRGPNSGCQSQTPPTKSSVPHMSPGAFQELRLLLAFLISTVQWGIAFHLSCVFPSRMPWAAVLKADMVSAS